MCNCITVLAKAITGFHAILLLTYQKLNTNCILRDSQIPNELSEISKNLKNDCSGSGYLELVLQSACEKRT